MSARLLAALALAGLMLAACADSPVSYESGRPFEPAYVALLVPAVQVAHDIVPTVETEEGAFLFRIDQTLFENGRAVGTAALRSTDQPGRGYDMRFLDGRLSCEDDVPVVYLTALVRPVHGDVQADGTGPGDSATGQRAQFIIRGGGAARTGWTVHILPHLEQHDVVKPIRFQSDLQVLFRADPCDI